MDPFSPMGGGILLAQVGGALPYPKVKGECCGNSYFAVRENLEMPTGATLGVGKSVEGNMMDGPPLGVVTNGGGGDVDFLCAARAYRPKTHEESSS